MGVLDRLRNAWRRPRFATGGVIPVERAASYDRAPAMLSSCAVTYRVQDETWREAMARLEERSWE